VQHKRITSAISRAAWEVTTATQAELKRDIQLHKRSTERTIGSQATTTETLASTTLTLMWHKCNTKLRDCNTIKVQLQHMPERTQHKLNDKPNKRVEVVIVPSKWPSTRNSYLLHLDTYITRR
jgi:hypothetical protein